MSTAAPLGPMANWSTSSATPSRRGGRRDFSWRAREKPLRRSRGVSELRVLPVLLMQDREDDVDGVPIGHVVHALRDFGAKAPEVLRRGWSEPRLAEDGLAGRGPEGCREVHDLAGVGAAEPDVQFGQAGRDVSVGTADE